MRLPFGRDWIVNYPGNRVFELDKSQIDFDFPWLVKAFKRGEDPKGVPLDVIEVKNASHHSALVLPKGKYEVEVWNLARESRKLWVEFN